MKEVLAIIRMEMINKTKEALLTEGFTSLNCRKVLGRGKKKVDVAVIESIANGVEISSPVVAQALSEVHRLVPKRLLSLFVKDDDVKKVIDTIIEVNSKGKAGDGKIFVMPVEDVVKVRTGETGEVAI
ncbi:MAG: Nitrogen regulatory protein P-II [Firmicutes bacterium ADurb.Bin419]|nr:MAG: Nitrogen regulatory protein P-II [Firmicutes bacterium ADurb.Bin419]